METSLSSFVDASSPHAGVLGESLISSIGMSGGTGYGTTSSFLVDPEDILTTALRGVTGNFTGSKSYGNSSSSSSVGQAEHNLTILFQLHNEFEKYKNQTQEHCNGADSIYAFANSYKKLHGYLALLVCVFGAIANVLIMVVLTRKEMRTPVNLMLFALAIADLLIMLEYIPFALHMYIIDHGPELKYSLPWAWFVFFHVHFTQILHTISIQLTLTMAIWRYAAIKCSNRSSNLCSFKRCYQAIAAAYICPLFLCILNYLYFQIVKKTKYVTYGPPPFNTIDEEDQEKLKIFNNACDFLGVHDCTIRKVDLYVVEMSDLAKNHPILHTMHFWTFSVLIKLIPCLVLTFFMCWLVNTLYKARRHHKMLERNTGYPMAAVTPNGETQPLSPSKNKTVHPESDKSLNRKVVTNGRNIRLGDEEGSPKTGLLTVENQQNGHGNHLLSVTNSPNPSPIPPESTCGSGLDSRRASGESGRDLKEGGRRFTKGFIRFPSIRRPSADKNAKAQKSCKRTDRTSKMLIAVLLLFLLTEFPQGVMHFLTGWYGMEFLRCNYNPWGEVFDMLAILNSAVNFILYCFMSKQFRTQFHLSFKLHLCFKKPKWMRMANCNNNATVSTTV